MILVVLIMSWCRPRPMPMILVIRRSGTSASGCLIDWRGSASGWRTASRETRRPSGSSPSWRCTGPGDEGLNLTAASRAAVLKYPWARSHYPDPHPTSWPVPPRGAGHGRAVPGAAKFSAYIIDLPRDAGRACARSPTCRPGGRRWSARSWISPTTSPTPCTMWRTSTDPACCSSRPSLGNFGPGRTAAPSFADLDEASLVGARRQPGAGLEWLRRQLKSRDDWIFDEDVFATAIRTVGDEFVDGVLATPYDGSMAADRAISGFTSRWIDHLISSVGTDPQPAVRSGYVAMDSQAWHEVSVLKFVNQYFILDRPDLAMLQRGQEQTVEHLVLAFDGWLSDPVDASRAPRRLLDLVNTATNAYQSVAREHPEWLGGSPPMPSWHGWAGVAASSTSSAASQTLRPSPWVPASAERLGCCGAARLRIGTSRVSRLTCRPPEPLE